MSYFASKYDELRFPVAAGPSDEGFRAAQLAALHAVCGHSFQSPLPAIVTMPTGSGKTAVLMALCFMLRATRVLVLTPSRLVREQIHENFATLGDLKRIGALSTKVRPPKAHATSKSVGSIEDWEAFRAFDIVVATVPSVSSKAREIPLPPADLFDLILVDEAHHSPASTWKRLLDGLSGARQVLFTATPYRRDEKLLPGRMVFTYPLERAQADGIFGDLDFRAVRVANPKDADIEIANSTARKFKEDRAAGLDHLVMVRTDSVRRGRELFNLYRDNTSLRLEFVNGRQSMRHVRSVIEKLKKREADGIVCVAMFGEGFNLPHLKIAAVHAPHRSLAVTLQFIGRFARTTASHIGRATFIAEEQSGLSEIDELFTADAAWSSIIANLSGARIAEESKLREAIESFEAIATPDVKGLSLGSLRPYFHVRAYRAKNPKMEVAPDFGSGVEIVYSARSEALDAVTLITRDITRARWSTDDRFLNTRFDLHIVCHVPDGDFLFIATSDRTSDVYDRMLFALAPEELRSLSSPEVNRVLNELDKPTFFNIGMRNRTRNGVIESYRMLSGPDAAPAVQASDGRAYDRGHLFAKGSAEGEAVTLGVSAASKIWSNRASQIPHLIEWCRSHAEAIASGILKPTGSSIDHLSAGAHLDALPSGIIGALWPANVYRDPPTIIGGDTGEVHGNLLDADLRVVESVAGSCTFRISFDDVEWIGLFSLEEATMITHTGGESLAVEVGSRHVPIEAYLSNRLPTFFTDKFGAIQGATIFPDEEPLELISDHQIERVDWKAAGVSITREKPEDAGSGLSIFEWLRERLRADHAFIYCDDASGEITDFLAVHWDDGRPTLRYFHCKASSEAVAGGRVVDLYDVCGQAVRTAPWMSPDKILTHVMRRGARQPERFVRGGVDDLREALSSVETLRFELIIVQPGLSRARFSQNISDLLSAANSYLIAARFLPLRIICSA